MFGQISLLFVAIFTSVAAQGCTPTFLDFSSMPDGMSPLNMGFIDVWCGKNTAISGGHLVLNVTQECGPDIASTTMVNAGKFEVNMTTGYSSGIVTAFTLLSEGTEQRDEMDMEFLGKNMSYVQTMYFVNGLRVPVHNTAEDIYVATDTSQSQHTYGMEYTPNNLTWFVDGKIVRTVQKRNGTQYPSKPMGLHLGLWDASQFSEWAGTANWSVLPPGGAFQAKISSLKITPYNCSSPLSPSSSIAIGPTSPPTSGAPMSTSIASAHSTYTLTPSASPSFSLPSTNPPNSTSSATSNHFSSNLISYLLAFISAILVCT